MRQGTNVLLLARIFASSVRNWRLFWRLFADRRVPLLVKAIPLGALLYVLSPIDLAPDLLLGLGQLDDLAILILGFRLFLELSPKSIVQEHLDEINLGPSNSRGQNEYVESSYRILDDEDSNR